MFFFFSPRPIYASAAAAAAAVAVVIILSNFFTSTFAATTLAKDEVEALREIGISLGKTDWDFGVDPCSEKSGWATGAEDGKQNVVTCSNHTVSNDTFNHVVSIVLKNQKLGGTLPPALVKLPYLQEIDLTRNYLSGSLPPGWGSMKFMQKLVVIGNGLTGPIPKEYGNITTLIQLKLEANQLSGPIPPEIGNLTAILELNLCSNKFTGKLPDTLAKLNTLTDFRISDNHFEGKIPDFIQNWTKLDRLNIQASGLDGPIPSRLIDSLTNLTDLRISDINGTEGEFPFLNNSKKIKTLILRSCNIKGELPNYFGGMKKLQTLDLSFNKLRGTIPNYFREVVNKNETNYIYLTGNLLSGPIPDWMNEGDDIDLSYNDFTPGSSGSCQRERVNLFASSSKSNLSGTVSCLSTPCLKLGHSFYINCGGRKLEADGHTYEDDTDQGKPAKFFQPNEAKWAFSSTGHFLDDQKSDDSYIYPIDSGGSGKSLWTDARLSPLSLTYYGFCLKNGNYTVRLHFAEIVFTANQTFRSLGRRIFDVYIQGILVLKDFNIEDKAGFGKTVEQFSASVINHTLEIRFYWAGRGTTIIPERGVYGPLISAISVENPDFADKGSISVRTVVGIVVAVSSAIFLVLGILWWKGCFHRKDTKELELKGLDLHTGSFTLRQIRAATSNFDSKSSLVRVLQTNQEGFPERRAIAMSRSLGIPVKLLHEAAGHIVTVELKSGELYRGSMIECEDNWNCQLENITYTAKDGKVSQLEHVFIRGSKVRFMVIPDMLKNAPMFKRLEARIKGKGSSIGVSRGRAVGMRARAQAAGRGAPPGRGVAPPMRR